MRKIIVLPLLCCSLLSRAQNCKDIQTGTFRITADDVNPNESILTRTKTSQIEEVKSLGLKFQFDLTWTSNCTYTLSHPKVLKGDYSGFKDGQEVYVKIIKVNSTYYIAQITSNFADLKLTKDIQIMK